MNKIKKFLGRPQVWGFFVSVAIMAVISCAFFYPDAFEGNVLMQHDMQQGAANGEEARQWEESTGEKALWTNALFSGMPTFQISPTYPSNSLFTWLNSVYGLWLPAPANLMFMMMFGFLILLYCLGLRWYYALIGAVAWGFSSYFVIIIGAGHIWKFLALSYIPPTIGGLLMLYRGRRIGGAALLALFAMLQLNANHPQMSYYFFFVMAAIAIAYLVDALQKGKFKAWAAATAIALGAGTLAAGANIPSLYNTYEYSNETKRSQSELTPLSATTDDPDAPRPTGGMPYNEIVGWSYGRSEMFSLLVPNIKGGATVRPEQGGFKRLTLGDLDAAKEYTDGRGGGLLDYLSQYFNDSEGTNGPVYVGALVAALFLLGCFIVGGPLKWALLTMTLLSVLLAMGANCAWLTDWMIYHFPLYNKFRAVESILVIAEFTIPLLAILGLHRLITAPDALKKYGKAVAWAFGIPAVICIAGIIAPGIFGPAITTSAQPGSDVSVSNDIQSQILRMGTEQGASQADIEMYLYYLSLDNPANIKAITALRHGMLRADALRSLLFIALGAAVIGLWLTRRMKTAWALAATGILILTDLYGVDKRYVSHSSFAPAPVSTDAAPFTPDAIDRAILADTASSYRVMDIPDLMGAGRSYFHKTIGGYHAAKLNRYEDLLQRKIFRIFGSADPADRTLNPEAYAVLDMLNARYIITGNPERPLMLNTHAQGNAWLVDSISWVDGADAEMAALSTVDLRRHAVADRRFADAIGSPAAIAAGDTIRLTYYSPNELRYHTDTRADGAVAVLSEVYFPWGWHADIDGREVPVARVNYVLRAVSLPAGSHTLTMRFEPQSLGVTGAAAYGCVTLIYLLGLAAIFIEYRRRCSLS